MVDTTLQKREAQRGEAEQIRSGPMFIPAVDIIETNNEILLLADMPGVKPDGMDINYEAGVLTIYGRVDRPQGDEDYLLEIWVAIQPPLQNRRRDDATRSKPSCNEVVLTCTCQDAE